MIAAVVRRRARRVASTRPTAASVGSPFYEAKLAWFDRLARWLAEAADPARAARARRRLQRRARRTPTSGTRGPATAGPTSRRRSARPSRGSARWGLVDAYRLHHPEPGRYTWWDYRAGNFHKNFGMRIDHLLVTRAARRAHGVGGDRPRGAQGQADALGPRAARDRPRRAGASASTPAGRRPRGASPRGAGADGRDAATSRSSRRSSRCWRSSRPSCPPGDGWLFEPKWDGFRAIVFRDGDRVYIQSRDLKPLDRYFPELAAPLPRAACPSAAWSTARS